MVLPCVGHHWRTRSYQTKEVVHHPPRHQYSLDWPQRIAANRETEPRKIPNLYVSFRSIIDYPIEKDDSGYYNVDVCWFLNPITYSYKLQVS
jgi:hypothetical protein